MATTAEYIEFICDQIQGVGVVRYKKMFGEYMVYVDDKPILLVCDSTIFVKKLECIEEKMKGAETGIPYKGAKEHYILDIDNRDLCKEVIELLKEVIPVPKPRKKVAK